MSENKSNNDNQETTMFGDDKPRTPSAIEEQMLAKLLELTLPNIHQSDHTLYSASLAYSVREAYRILRTDGDDHLFEKFH